MNQDNVKTESAAAHEANLSEGVEKLKAIQKETDDAKKKTLAEMTASDKRRLKAIEKCAKLLEDEEIPFLLFASIDKTGTTRFGPRGWWQYNCFAFPDKGEDKMEAKVKKSNRVIPALFPTVLNHMSNITYGWAYAVYGKDDQPFAVHQYGEQIYPESKPSVPMSQGETVDINMTTTTSTPEVSNAAAASSSVTTAKTE